MRPNARRLGAAVLALIFGAVGIATLIRYVQTAEDRALAGQQLVDVLVVTEPVAAGTAVDEMTLLVENRQVPASSRTPGAVTELGSLDGLVTSVDLVPGEQLLAARFEDGTIRRLAGGDEQVPVGLIEMTVQVVPTRAVGGQIAPGDKVAVVAFFADVDPTDPEPNPASGVLLRQALVTNIQSAVPPVEDETQTDRSRVAPATDFLVTLAIEPTQTERLVFANEYGRIWLAREGEDPAIESGDLISLKTIFEGGLGEALSSGDAESLAATDEAGTEESDAASTTEEDDS